MKRPLKLPQLKQKWAEIDALLKQQVVPLVLNSLGPIRFFHVNTLRHDVINIINISGVNEMG